MTVLEVIKRSAQFLDKKGVESPRLQVELLLAHLLGLPRMRLYLDFERLLTPKELEDLRALVVRRGQREPLQHILGTTSFWGLEMTVNSSVLVPRPETEMLAEMGWEFLGKMSNVECRMSNGEGTAKSEPVNAPTRDSSPSPPPGVRGHMGASEGGPHFSGVHGEEAEQSPPAALDFGTGSGCLAIALAWKCPNARIVAMDVSPEALAVARANAARHQVESRIEFILGDGLAAVPASLKFDLIVSNPPYISSAEIATLDPEVRDHDPRLALDGGADGLEFYRRLSSGAGEWLRPGGRIMLEFGDGQAPAVGELFAGQKWIVEAVKADYNGKPRFMTARRND